MDEERSPAGQDGAEKKSNLENANEANTASPQFQEGKTSANTTSKTVQTELASILTDIANAFKCHLSLPPGAPEALALWVISAHTLEYAEYSPRLVFQSPMPECGKSTGLELLIELAPNPAPTSNISSAGIYRSLETGSRTLIIDEADTFMENTGPLTGILNSGHKRATAFVDRCVFHKNNYKPKKFPTFCPMAIARIGELPAALESRSIVIRMQRAKPNEQIARFTSASRVQLKDLKGRIERWLKTGEQKSLKDASPPLNIRNRLADNWRHLVAIADLAGGDWPRIARSAIDKFRQTKDEVGVLLLEMIKQTFDTRQQDKISSTDLCNSLNNSPEKLQDWNAQTLASALRPFGIRPKMIRLGSDVFRGYERKQFIDTWERYLDGNLNSPED